ncbi:hypothetical protein LTR85_000178 [Meristemomyces frigidus]|nr:hypothetical protein LTR85_000178 [Meristemomyces frigidus]
MNRLLDLPPEIRNNIYEYVLIFREPLQIRHRHLYDINMNNRALLQTCQQIRAEALGIYLSNNTFVLSTTRDLGNWLDSLGSTVKQLNELTVEPGVLERHNSPGLELASATRVPVKLALVGGEVVVNGVDGDVLTGCWIWRSGF